MRLVFILLIILVVGFAGCGFPILTASNEIQSALEKAYFEGQKDAINGDIRIKFDEEFQCYRWAKTPWNDGTKPLLDISGLEIE